MGMDRKGRVRMVAGFCCVLCLLVIGCEGDSDDASDGDSEDSSEDTSLTNDTTVIEPVAVDEIPASSVMWIDEDVGGWEITSKLDVSLSGSLINYDQDGTSKWPEEGGASGNAWVLIFQDGMWYGATDEWMTPGQTQKNKSSVSGANMKKFDYFSSDWLPTPGVQYGFMVSGLARTSDRNVEERTQIMLMTWE